MPMTVSVYTVGGGDLITAMFNSIAAIFNNSAGIGTITSLAITIGGLLSVFEFSRSRDIAILMKWMGMYVVITSLVLYPKVTVQIEDMSGLDIKPRAVDHVPLSLGVFASITSTIGVGFTQKIESVFHMPDDFSYSKTGMLMGSRLFLASRDFEINDSKLTETMDEFMQQCVFYDILLNKYTVDDLMHAGDPWAFISANTSVARSFSLNGTITPCKDGVSSLGKQLNDAVNKAALVYGGQIIGNANSASTLLTHLGDGYNYLTKASVQGDALLKTNLLSNTISQAVSRYGASINAPAALQAYTDTKTELQSRETMDLTGRQAAIWMQYFKNIIEAVLYGSFVFIYFLSYLPFGGAIIKNYLCGMFIIQALAPMYAIINYAATFLAQSRALHIIGLDYTDHGASMATLAGITQANADAVAVAGYLIWPVTIGGAMMIYRGLPSAIQSMGQLMGGVVQNAGSHIVAEAVGGNISAGNTNFGNHSMNNTNANHFDTNARYSAGGAALQTGNGSSMSIMPSGNEVLDNRGSLSNLSVNVHMAESMRMAASQQAQSSLNASLSMTHAAGEQYASGLREIDDYAHQNSRTLSSGISYGQSESSGTSSSANQVSNLVESFRKEHHISHEKAMQLFGQIYADSKMPIGLSGNASISGRSAFGSLYNDAKQYATDNNFTQAVDHAKRDSIESSYRDGSDSSNRYSETVAKSFDSGDSYRQEAASQYSKSVGYSNIASATRENSSSIDANYTQSFFEWMKHQPSPSSKYGQGTWSKSAIDELAVHDPATLQGYADKFVSEKTNEAITNFQRSNHISDGGRYINQNVENNNHKSDINQSSNQLIHEENSVQGKLGSYISNHEAYGEVNSQSMNEVKSAIHTNQKQLEASQLKLATEGSGLQDHIKEKVDGQIIGSITPPSGSLLETLEGKSGKKQGLFGTLQEKGK